MKVTGSCSNAPPLIFIVKGALNDLFIPSPVLNLMAGPTPSRNPSGLCTPALWTFAVTLTAEAIIPRDYLDQKGTWGESPYIFMGRFVPPIVNFTTDFIFRDPIGSVFQNSAIPSSFDCSSLPVVSVDTNFQKSHLPSLQGA